MFQPSSGGQLLTLPLSAMQNRTCLLIHDISLVRFLVGVYHAIPTVQVVLEAVNIIA